MHYRIRTTTGPKVVPAPEIDFSKTVVLVAEGNRPELYHEFHRKSELAIRAALGARRPLLVRGRPCRQDPARGGRAAPEARVAIRCGAKPTTCSGNSKR
jgi:hypothetical protein